MAAQTNENLNFTESAAGVLDMLRSTLFVLISFTLANNAICQIPIDNDLTGTFGKHLNIYVLNGRKTIDGLSDFDDFVLESVSGDNINNPKLDALNAADVGGLLHIKGKQGFKIIKGKLRKNADGKFECLTFETETVEGIHFTFSGYFLRKRKDEDIPYVETYLVGTVNRFRGKTLVSRSTAPFTIKAEM